MTSRPSASPLVGYTASTLAELVQRREVSAVGAFARRHRLVSSRTRDAWCRLNDAFFEQFDVLLTPVLATRPLEADGWSSRSWFANVQASVRFAPFTSAWNFAGYPAASVPAGFDSDGLPLAVQLVSAPGREALILSLAKQLELLQPWPRHAPPPY